MGTESGNTRNCQGPETSHVGGSPPSSVKGIQSGGHFRMTDVSHVELNIVLEKKKRSTHGKARRYVTEAGA